MSPRTRCRKARREELGLRPADYAALTRLRTPARIQAFVGAIPANHEPDGETLHSVHRVLRLRVAHCMEGALVAACALWIQGEPPLLLHLDCAVGDHPHVVALFRRGRAWGAISKSNGAWLRFREPVYRNLRELAMSYFHEFFDHRGHKTLRSYGRPFDLRTIDAAQWVSGDAPCWDVHDRLARGAHRPLLTAAQARALSRRDAFERASARLVEYPPPA
ncbi:MAG: hypothetical protein IT516_05680 [Burkholderiales bacterium]|nr:hypothetical protein [Burkholderiales bacterium]